MSTQFDSFIAASVDLGCFGTLRTDGHLKGGGATDPADGDPVGSGMIRIKGITNAAPTIAPPDVLNIGGDGISQGQFALQSLTNPAFDIDKSVFNLVNDAIIQRTKVKTLGGIHMGILKPNSNDPEDLCVILQSMTKKKDTGLSGLKGWSGYWLPIVNGYPLGRQAFGDRAAAADRWRMVTNPADQLMNGIAIDKSGFGTDGGCIVPFTNDWPLLGWTWRGDGETAIFTLPVTPGEYSADQIIITVNGVLAVYTTAYSASGLTLTFASGHIPALHAKIDGVIGYDPNA